MMYFLVSRPPKIFGAVSPAFSATSVKLATGAGGGAFARCAERTVTTKNDAQKKNRMMRAKKLDAGFCKGMGLDDVRSARAEGQARLSAQPALPRPRHRHHRLRTRKNAGPAVSPCLRQKRHSEPDRAFSICFDAEKIGSSVRHNSFAGSLRSKIATRVRYTNFSSAPL